jgi:hypothetical protein
MLCSVAFAQIPTAQPPNTNINPPQRQKAPAGPQQRLPGGTPPQTVMRPPANGAIAGYVYWDTNFVAHTPANNCIGLGAVVSVGTPTQGSPTFQQFKTLGLYQNFTYLGNVGSLAVCQYSIPQVPTGVDLRVWIYFKLVFTPQVLASVPTTANNPSGTIKISGGTCNQVPPAVPNASVLGSGWWTCGNNAYNVNFVLQPATPGNMVSGSGQFTVQSATPPGSANGGQNPTNPGMLSGSNQSRGMLAPGATQSAQPGTPATLLGNRQPPASQSGGFQNPGSKVELNSQPLPPRQGNNVTALQSTSYAPAGNVDGYVLWDTSLIQYQLSTPCQGLQVIVVDMGNNSQPTLATSNNLTPVWSTPQLNSATANQNYNGPTSKGPWMVCHYSFSQLPEKEALEVRANVTQSSAFSPQVTPAMVTGSMGTAFTIPPGNCNTRRPRPTLSTILGAFTEFCGEHAFNVNVELFPAGMGSIGSLPANSVVQDVASVGGGAMLNSSSNQGGMLSGAQQAGTLLGNRQASLTPNRQAQSRGSKVSLNPQPLPPGAKGAAPARTKLQPVKLAPPTASRKLTNPYLSQQKTSIIAVLEQQRQAATADAAAMRAGAGTIARASAARTSALSANVLGNSVPALGPETVQSSNVASKIAHAPAFNSVVLICSTDPTPRILRVNGGEAPGIFTPEAKYNQYTIVGCGFGQSQGTARIFGVNGFTANLNIDFWGDNGITAHLDPWLAGVLDQNNVSLVVLPVGKPQLKKSGFTFYAARGMPAPDGGDQEVQLAYDSMPHSMVGLVDVNNFLAGFDQLPSNAVASFPSFSFQGTPVAGWVFRYLYAHRDRIAALRTHDCFINDVGYDGDVCNFTVQQQKPDTWDFNGLVSGFTVSSYALYYEDIDPATLCGAWADMDHWGSVDGNWDFNLNQQNQIVVTSSVYSCHDVEFGTRDNFADQSSYGLAIWVLGPRCVDPWTGQKDQACMNKVKQNLS